jgi:hypothetical protein
MKMEIFITVQAVGSGKIIRIFNHLRDVENMGVIGDLKDEDNEDSNASMQVFIYIYAQRRTYMYMYVYIYRWV